ncbi:radical SAM protein [Halobacteriovorax sp. GB3]|uniref:radical SAM protein n=1 Tax=Halobacteriovorax sp. GB3 TaxID=2719615 RepID=UPI00235EB73A|nr:radical SAM protein [Halobacteriovorax sp. GB3]MDD0854370.1 radical SAM protein [Halobacteriovorax sp. GB3]
MNKLPDKLSKEEILEIELELTGTCNLDCPLCSRSYENAKHLIKYNERSVEEIKKQLDEYPNIEMCCMAGIISEPTLHKRFLEIIEYLRSRNIAIELYSNASVHSEKWWAELATLMGPCDRVFFTICGSNQELHEKYRVNSSLEKILNNHRAFKNNCEHPIDTLQHIKFEYNSEDFESKEMQAIRARFSREENINTLPYNERFKFIEDEDNKIKLSSELARSYNLIAKNAKRRYQKNKSGEMKCQMRCKSLEERFVAIDQFGEITPCFLYRIYNGDEKFNLDYTKINKFTYDFCYECEAVTTQMLEDNGLERMG